MLEKEHLITQRRLPWPKRFDVTLLSFLALVIGYFDRVNISVAAPSLMQEYRWDIVQMGWVLSGFFMGYTLFMIPAGILADRYGSKRVFAASMTWWSVFTVLTPLPKSLAVLVLIRSLVGAGQSAIIPSTNSILVKWFPHQEYARATGFCWSGGYAGPIFALPLASIILQTCGWRWVFLAF